jgi:ferrous iron transport protein A
MAADPGPTLVPIRLDALPIGRVGTVASVAADVADAQGGNLVRRLMELGFLPGESVRVLHRAFPSGDPLAVRIGNSTFALRRFEAALVAVTLG